MKPAARCGHCTRPLKPWEIATCGRCLRAKARIVKIQKKRARAAKKKKG